MGDVIRMQLLLIDRPIIKVTEFIQYNTSSFKL